RTLSHVHESSGYPTLWRSKSDLLYQSPTIAVIHGSAYCSPSTWYASISPGGNFDTSTPSASISSDSGVNWSWMAYSRKCGSFIQNTSGAVPAVAAACILVQYSSPVIGWTSTVMSGSTLLNSAITFSRPGLNAASQMPYVNATGDPGDASPDARLVHPTKGAATAAGTAARRLRRASRRPTGPTPALT